MTEKLEVLILATDQASETIKGLGGLLGGVFKVGAGLAAAGITAFGAGLAYAVSEAMDAELVAADLAAVLKSTGGVAGVTAEEATNLANSLSQVTRFSDESILSAENMLLTFTNIGKNVFPQATETLLDLATKMKTDASGAAIQLGKALNDPVTGITALTRVGVTFTDQQKDMIKALVEAGKTEEAQKIILDELAREFGGAAEAAGATFAGQLDILKNNLSNVAENVGTAMIPALQELMDSVITPLLPLIEQFALQLARDLPPAIEAVAKWVKAELIPALSTAYTWFNDNILPVLKDVWTWLSENLPPAIQKLSEYWTNTLKPALETAWKYFNENILPVLKELYDWLYTNLPPTLTELARLWNEEISPALSKAYDWFKTYVLPIITELADILSTSANKTFATLGLLWKEEIGPALSKAWEIISTYLLPLLKEFSKFVEEYLIYNLGRLQKTLADISQAIKDFDINKLLAIFGIKLGDGKTGNSPTYGPPSSGAYVPPSGGGGGGGNNGTAPSMQSAGTYNLTIISNSPTEMLAADFRQMQAWARA